MNQKIKTLLTILSIILIFSAGFIINYITRVEPLGATENTFPTTLNSWVEGDIIEEGWANALESKIGVDGSAITTSLDYLVKNASSSLYRINKTNGGFVVGDGTNFVLESGATARTSIGLGTTDNPTFANLTITAGTSTQLYTTQFGINSEYFTDLTGTGLTISSGTLIPNLTGGTGITFSNPTVSFDCSEVEGTGINCATEAITLDATGDWTGTLDTWEGTVLFNVTSTQMASDDYGGFDCDGTDAGCTIDDLFLLNTGDIGTGNYTFSNIVDFSQPPTSINPTTSDQLAIKEYVDLAASVLINEFFLTTSTTQYSDIFIMQDFETGRSESSIASSTLPEGDDQLLFQFITATGTPAFRTLQAGIYDGHFHFERTGGNRTTNLYWTLTASSTDGTQTFLIMSELSKDITNDKEKFDIHAATTSEIILTTGDRLILKIYGNLGGGSNTEITIYQEGTTDSHIAVPVSTDVFNDIYLRQDGIKALTGNWGVGGFNITGIGTLSTTNLTVTATTTLESDLLLKDDKYLYFDTAKTVGVRYESTNWTDLIWTTTYPVSTEGTLYLSANVGADGSGSGFPTFGMFSDGSVSLINTNQGDAGDRYFRINMTNGIRLDTGGKNAVIKADNVATADKTFQFPNLTGTFLMATGTQDILTTGYASTTGLSITGITGSTQCLQVDTNGKVSGSGSACGGTGGINWEFIGANAIRPTTTVGIIVSASSTISALTVTYSTTTGILAIPTSASLSLSQEAQFGYDKTTGQLRIHDGTADRVLTTSLKAFTIGPLDNPVASDQIPNHFKAPFGMTITQVDCLLDPADTTGIEIDIDIFEADGNGDSTTTIFNIPLTVKNTNTVTSTFANAVIDSGDWVGSFYSNASGTASWISCTVKYRITAD